MSPRHTIVPRGRGHSFPAARFVVPLLATLSLACQQDRAAEPPNDSRTIVAAASAGAQDCGALPDTTAELLAARPDENDLPVTRILLEAACPRASVLFIAGARIPRTYRVHAKAGQTLVVRARGESGPVVLNFDFPAAIAAGGANYGATVVDSLRVTADRDVAIRVMLIPRARDDARTSRVLLTVLARPASPSADGPTP